MKRFLLIIFSLISLQGFSQIPFFGTTVGEHKTYTYLQWKAHPGHNSQSYYMSVKYGVTPIGDLSFSYNDMPGYNVSSFGWTQNIITNKYVNFGIQPMVSFDMRDNFKFSDLCTGFYIHGNIVGNLGYDLNTWWTLYKHSNNVTQWSYLTYAIGKFYPMVGVVTDISNHWKSDLAFGGYFPICKNSYVYLWTANVTKNLGNNRIIIGIDYKF